MLKVSWRAYAHKVFATLSVASAVIAIGMTGEKSSEKIGEMIQDTDRPAAVTAKVSANSRSNSKIAVQEKIPAALSPMPWLERAAQLTSLREFLEIIPQKQAHQLVQSLMEDEFERGNPFANLSSHYPLALLLAKGVSQYSRTTYRTTEFRGEEGYDLITYDVTHNDGAHSSIMAYMDKSKGDELDTLTTPKRSVYVVFNLSESSRTSYYNLYRDNELFEHMSLESSEAVAKVNHRVNASVPFTAVSIR